MIIVSYNTRNMTLACLESIYRQADSASLEILVIDNSSTDDSVAEVSARFPQTRLIASDVNLGFAGANNLAAGDARGDYILLLNPDTVVRNHAIDRLVRFAEANPEAAIFGGRTVFGDGSLNPASCFRSPSLWGLFCRAFALDAAFPNSEFFNRDCYGGWKRDTVREVDIVSGCFLLIRRAVWEELGGFDTDYFMYGEDWDLCMRARERGYRCLLCPEAEIIHYGGASEPLHDGRIIRLLQTKVLLFRKRWPVRSQLPGVALLRLWVLIRMMGFGFAGLFARKHRENYQCWRRIWAAREEWCGRGVGARGSA